MEYVLLLVVTIGLLIAVAAQVFTPFNKWAKTYMGSYIGCLLDAGELPMLGTTGSGADNICNGKFEQFSIGSGRSPKIGSSAEEAANRKKSDGNKDSASSGAGGGGSGGAGQRPEDRGFKIGASKGADGGAAVAKTSSEGAGGSEYYRSSGGASGLNGGNSKRRIVEGPTGQLAYARDREKKKEDRVRAVASADEGVVNSKSKKFIVKPQEKSITEDEKTEPWGLGKVFRFAMILLLLIAIILFVGGQALQISKSMDK